MLSVIVCFSLCVWYILYCGLVTAAASALHGGGYLSKGYIVALHVLLFPPAIMFWVFLRRGVQAKAELDLIRGNGNYAAVRKAYPLGLGYIMAHVMRWVGNHHWPYREDGSPNWRTQQELCGGAVLGAFLATPVAIVALVWVLI